MLSAKGIRREVFPVYFEKCSSPKAMGNCAEKFSQGRSHVVDEERTGRRIEIATEATMRRVRTRRRQQPREF